ncbi:MAG: YXWGXW repeat-containing protein [Rhodoferax sp.]|uniref:YXWGXW repeat-containing protein n=1 Tax=Rhodoferax sp. TaxID=50421 RepID=UPI001B672B87|nr:YXWGXW repeat-containing protein [Rhodoferax sp.]MBP9906076.1 YXWGXW repeat-containing protein [Rhodoferax sp.]
MKLSRLVQGLLLAVTLATGAAASAQVSLRINIGPPPLIFEPVPMMAPGYIWAPGYWAWNHDRHIWVRGRAIVQRQGYRWEPDRWEQRGNIYYRQPGNWSRESQYQPPRAHPNPRLQQPKRPNGKAAKRGPWEEPPHDNRRR